MSVADKYEEGKLALQRASMTLEEWVDEVKSEATPEWLVINIDDPVGVLELAAAKYLPNHAGIITVNDVFDFVVRREAKSRMQKARDDYEEQYGRRV